MINLEELNRQLKEKEALIADLLWKADFYALQLKTYITVNMNSPELFIQKQKETVIDSSDPLSPSYISDPSESLRPYIIKVVQATNKYNQFIKNLVVPANVTTGLKTLAIASLNMYLDHLRPLVIAIEERENLKKLILDLELVTGKEIADVQTSVIQAPQAPLIQETYKSEVDNRYVESALIKEQMLSTDVVNTSVASVDSPKLSLADIKTFTQSSSTTIESDGTKPISEVPMAQIELNKPKPTIGKKLLIGASVVGLYFLTS